MALTFNAGVVECIRTVSGGPPITLGFAEGSTQVFKRGDMLVFTSGQVTLAGSAPLAGSIVGVAAQDATGVQGTNILVWMAAQENIFIANFGTVSGNNFTGTAVPTTVSPTIGTLTRVTGQVLPTGTVTLPTARWVWDTSFTVSTALTQSGATNNARCVILLADPRDGIIGTDLGGRVHFQFLDVVYTNTSTITLPFAVKAFLSI